jgi:hypothetical protein
MQLFLIAVLSGAALTGSLSLTSAELPNSFVTRDGASVTLYGVPFRFVGVNAYDSAGDPAIYQCGTRLRTESGAKVVRFWAFQQYTAGGTNWSALDRVIRLAREHNLKLIPVLENQWAECTQGGYKFDDWYARGYLSPYGGYALSYREYLRRVLQRYRDEPTIMAWSLMNEPESKSASGTPAPEPLYSFAQDVSALAKSLDPNHLVTLGVAGGAQPGVRGDSYEQLHSLETIDFAEFHDYGANDEPLPGPATRVAMYIQDNNWTWTDLGYRRLQSESWVTLTGALPSGARPFQRVGFDLVSESPGSFFIDSVDIGGRHYNFEDGTTKGWQASTNVALSTAEDVPDAGSRSLQITFGEAAAGQVWLPADKSDGPGTPIVVRIWAQAPGPSAAPDSLLAATEKAEKLGKPLLMGEAGMTTCTSIDGSVVETADSRATKLDAKISAFFELGGAGYLVWAWHPTSGCSYNFTSGDPLNRVLGRYATSLSGE